MKTSYMIPLLSVAALLSLGSCTDKLDIPQQGVLSPENYYQTDDEAESAVATCYADFRILHDGLALSWIDGTQIGVKTPLADEVYSGGGSFGDIDNYFRLSGFTHTETHTGISAMYANSYNLIYAANLVLEKVNPETSPRMARCVAEAHFFRAYAYLDLIIYFGEVPYVDHVIVAGDYPGHCDKATLWTLVENDLNAALSLPSKKSKDDYETAVRVTKEAVQAYLAKAYLWQGKYEDAARVAGEVIDSELYDLVSIDDFGKFYHVSGNYNEEYILFTNRFVNDNDNAFAQSGPLPLFTQWRFQDTFRASSDTYIWSGANQGYGGLQGCTKSLYDAFEPGDGRRPHTVVTVDEAAALGVTLNSKATIHGCEGYLRVKHLAYKEDISNSNSFAYYGGILSNRCVMRLGELLLIGAEAALQSGDQQSADKWLSRVRVRAGLNGKSGVTMEDIKREKRVEMALEGCRFEDLVRWGDAAAVLGERGKLIPRFNYEADGSTWNVTWDNDNQANDPGFKSGKNELLPFPQSARQNNPNLGQNEGY